MEEKWFERTLIVLGIIGLAVILWAGIADAAGTVCQIANGCTGTSTTPAYGKVLVGDNSGNYEFVATSTFGAASAGTVTSVGLSTPNATLTLGGTNPITTSGTISTDLNLAHTNWWTARQNFTNATTSGLEATSTDIFLDSYTSALLTVNSSHQLTAYGGASACTNQFVTALSALGATTCASVIDADFSGQLGLSHGGTNASLSGANQILTMNSGNTAVTTAGSGYTITSTLAMLTNASTTNLTAGTSLGIPSSSNPSPTVAGYVAESSDAPYQIHIGNGNSGTVVYDPRRMLTVGYPDGGATSTWTGTTTVTSGFTSGAMTFNTIQCATFPAGSTLEVRLYYGPTPTSFYYQASSTGGIEAITTNNTPGANASTTVDFGNPASSPTSVTCTVTGELSGV